MYRLLFLLLVFSQLSVAQTKYTYSSAFRPYTLNEKNIVRINSQEQDSIQYLIPYKDLLVEATTYFQSYIPSETPIKSIEVVSQQNHYYLVQHNKTHAIVSYLHPTIRLDVEATFLILGSNHCIVPITEKLCYPSLQPHTCLNKQVYCQKLDTKQ